jgi:hypothetical protein
LAKRGTDSRGLNLAGHDCFLSIIRCKGDGYE